MQIHNIGPDDFIEKWSLSTPREWAGDQFLPRAALDTGRFLWMVIWYVDEHYDGAGEMVALGHDGLLHRWDLSHSDGYSPIDNWDKEDQSVAVADYVRQPSTCARFLRLYLGVAELQAMVLSLLSQDAAS